MNLTVSATIRAAFNVDTLIARMTDAINADLTDMMITSTDDLAILTIAHDATRTYTICITCHDYLFTDNLADYVATSVTA